MDRKAAFFVAAVGLAIWYAASRTGSTLGDEESNVFEDGVDDLNNIINGWPKGSDGYQDLIAAASASAGVPTSILAWLLWKESRFLPDVVTGARKSSAGAMGIAQFMPATAKEVLGSEAAALDPSKAIPGAARLLASLYKTTGTWAKALAAYNWGIGNVTRKGIENAPRETVDYYTTILAKANISGGNWK